METFEPCQDRNVAALRRTFHVPRDSRQRANCFSSVCEWHSKQGVRIKGIIKKSVQIF